MVKPARCDCVMHEANVRAQPLLDKLSLVSWMQCARFKAGSPWQQLAHPPTNIYLSLLFCWHVKRMHDDWSAPAAQAWHVSCETLSGC